MAPATASTISPRSTGFRRAPIRRFLGHSLLQSPQALQRLVPDRTEEIGPERRALRIEATFRPQQRQEAFLYDVLRISHRARKPPRESEERKVVIVEEPEERYFLPSAGIAEEALGRFS